MTSSTPLNEGSRRMGLAIGSLVWGLLAFLQAAADILERSGHLDAWRAFRLVHLRSGLPAELFGGFSFLCLLGILGTHGLALVAAHRASSRPGEYGGDRVAAAGAGFAGLAFVLLVLGSSLDSRIDWNEDRTVADIREMIRAQSRYCSLNGGLYDTPDCLSAPARCLPGAAADAPVFFDERMAELLRDRLVKNGYVRQFRLGATASPEKIAAAAASPTSAESFAYVAVPIAPGESGLLGFCGDSSGRICFHRRRLRTASRRWPVRAELHGERALVGGHGARSRPRGASPRRRRPRAPPDESERWP